MNSIQPPSPMRHAYKLAAGTAMAAPVAAQAASIGPLVGALSPWFLLAVPAVGTLWWLMKNIPKTPIRRVFAGISLLYNLKAKEQTATRVPWWQYIPIALATASVVGIFAKPEWNPQTPLEGNGPLVVVVDNGWSPARNWKAPHGEMKNLVERADRAGRSLIILPTAAPTDGSPIRAHGPMNAAEAREFINKLKPQPWPSNREKALGALSGVDASQKTTVIWFSDGLNDKSVAPLAAKLQSLGTLTVLEDDKALNPRLIDPPTGKADSLTVTVRRSQTDLAETIIVTAADETGKPIDNTPATFKPGENQATAVFKKLTNDVANQVTSVTIEGDNTAGARVLMDERFRRRPVGIIQAGNDQNAQPLTSETDYISQALGSSVIQHQGSVDDLLKRDLAALMMADSADVGNAQAKKIEEWVSKGGTLIRFAGPKLAAQPATVDDPLLPVKLRPESRTLGGTVSGSKEGKIQAFVPKSPFANINIPDNVSIKQYVVPQPGQAHDGNTWASLQDKTPLVTVKKHGSGQIILMHTTADPSWTNIPYSGLFVEMTRAMVKTSQGVAGKLENGEISLPPVKVMDGQGRLGSPASSVRPLTAEAINTGDVGPQHPPGFYGNESAKQAHNLSVAVPELKPMTDLPADVARRTYEAGKKDSDLTGYMWASAFGFLLLELALMLRQRQGLRSEPKKPSLKPAALTPDN